VEHKFLYWVVQYGNFAIFVLLMLGIAGLPVPDEIILTFVGYLIFKGVLRPLPTIITAFLGSVCGISLSYFLGRTVGFPLVARYGRIIRLNPNKIYQVHDWFTQIGKWTLFIGYFIPGVRHFTGFVAGTSQLEMQVFARYAYAGAFCWSMSFLSIGFYLGKEWFKIRSHLYLVSIFGIVLFLAMILGYLLVRQKNNRITKGNFVL
jgi:membrane protein DedA with SNARE-associated domain